MKGLIYLMELILFNTALGLMGLAEEDGAVIDLYVMIRYGHAIPEVAERMQSAVSTAVESMTGFAAKAVNVHVGGVTFQ